MADNEIAAALAGQPGTSAAATAEGQTATEQAQPQVNYVTSEQLNAAVEEMKRMVQSSTDKSYNRVQKMIENLKQAGIQNPTEAQARAMLAQQEQQSEPQDQAPAAQPAGNSAADPAAAAWIRNAGGDPTKDYWNDIYDAAQEAGVGIITREDPEYAQYFEQDGKPKNFQKARQFVRAFEQAFEAKKQRLAQEQAGEPQPQQQREPSLASSPALGGGGGRSSYIDPKTTSANSLITAGLHK